jgi:polyvinyl alcohol dehydrogenase (cytochrome)
VSPGEDGVGRAKIRLAALLALAAVGCGEESKPSEGEPAISSWPSFGHDLANTRSSDDSALSPASAATLVRRWEVPMPGCTGTPAVVDGVAYVGDWGGTLHAVKVADGAVLWSKKLSDSAFDASPLVHEGRIYVGDGTGNLHAVDQTNGEPLWSVELDPHDLAHVYGSAIAVDGKIVVGVASIELVLSLPDYTFRGSVVALDASSGAEQWRVYMTEDDATSGAGVSVWSSPAVDTELGLLYIGTGQTYEPPASPRSDALIAIRYADGSVAWQRQFTADDVYTVVAPPPKGPDADVGAAPNLFMVGDRPAVGVGDKAGVLSVLDRETGETLWAEQLTAGAQLGGVMSSAAHAGGKLFVTSNVWNSDTLNLDEPDPADGSVVFGIDVATGQPAWQHDLPAPSVGGVAHASGVVFHSIVTGTLYARDAETGAELWSDTLGHRVAGGASIAEGHVLACHGFYFFTSSGELEGGLVAYSPE